MQKTVTVVLGSTNYQCRVTDGGHSWLLDEPLEKGGGNTAPDPIAALLASLGSCSAITVKMYAQHKGWSLEAVEVSVHWEQRWLNGEKVSVFQRDLVLQGAIDEGQRIRLQQIAQACPVSRILEGKCSIDTTITNR